MARQGGRFPGALLARSPDTSAGSGRQSLARGTRSGQQEPRRLGRKGLGSDQTGEWSVSGGGTCPGRPGWWAPLLRYQQRRPPHLPKSAPLDMAGRSS